MTLATVFSLPIGAADGDGTAIQKAPGEKYSGIQKPEDLSHVAGFLTPEDLASMAATSRGYKGSTIFPAANTYAECVVANQPVPEGIKDILGCVINPVTRKKIAEAMVRKINELTGGDVLALIKPLPPFLRPYFRQITPEDLTRCVSPLVASGVVPAAALLHMETCVTSWVKPGKSPAETDQDIINYAQTYTTLQQALTIPVGTPVPKHIIATEAEVRDANQTAATNAFFQRLRPSRIAQALQVLRSQIA